MILQQQMDRLFERSRKASDLLAAMNAGEKNALLLSMADRLERNASPILEANRQDMADARSKHEGKASDLDRLMLDAARLHSMAGDIRAVAALPDPVGAEEGWATPNGLRIRRVRAPFGVIAAVYENRPNVTTDIASLCIKSGNACILRGSASALRSNRAILQAVQPALPDAAVLLVDTPDRAAIDILMAARGRIDLLIPRGGAELIQHTVQHSRVPVIETGTGNCHVFVDESADQAMAVQIILNAKCQRPGVCNAQEKLLVHRAIASVFLPKLARELRSRGVELRGCPKTRRILPDALPATEEDWPKEYLDLILAIKVVSDADEAVAHINRYNSKHTEAIVTRDYPNAEKFMRQVDAAVVMVNASTRFTDGGQFGFGAEIGISTQKLHARGPVGLRELTCIKYLVEGNGQVRE